MNVNLFKHISEYFNAFPKEDYTIYVNGIPTEWCGLNNNSCSVVYIIPPNSSVPNGIIYDNGWYTIYDWEIEAIRLTPTILEIIQTNGKEYTFTAKIKRKDEKAKDIILKTKDALNDNRINDAQYYLDKLKGLLG